MKINFDFDKEKRMQVMREYWEQFRNQQQEWVDTLYQWAENELPLEIDWENPETKRSNADVTLRLREAAEAVVRYTADTETKNSDDFARLIRLINEQRKTIDWRSDRLSDAVDRLIEVADEKLLPQPIHAKNEHVILLHGLGRTNLSMVRMEQNLRKQGYQTTNIDYPSTQYPIEYLVDQHILPVLENQLSSDTEKIHFVTHSMGGILVRFLNRYYRIPHLGRVVMLSPPNQGSEIVDLFYDNPLFYTMNGPAGKQLGIKQNSLPLSLGAVDFELGILMGDRSFDPLFPLVIDGDNDGKVSIERAKVDGMKEFLVLPHSHTFIMHSPRVIKRTVNFIENGHFE